MIERLDIRGDGRAGDAAVPFTLPGERVRPGAPPAIVDPSPDRIAPVCPHFGLCGGCRLQHASDRFLAEWKVALVRQALAARGLAAPIQGIHSSPPGSRRRATFAGRRTRTGAEVGFYTRASDRIVAIRDCPLIRLGMLSVLPILRAITATSAARSRPLRLSVTESTTGWDIAVEDGKPLDTDLAAALTAVAGTGIARLAWGGEVVFQADPPVQAMGPARVVPPPGAFLQATAEGARALTAAVQKAVGDAPRIADLFAGCGTFALPLARRASVAAFELDPAMVAALDGAWRAAPGLKEIRAEARDLFRRPLTGPELRGVDAVVLDPPRAGAEAQAKALAEAGPPVIAAVSCNPVSFARDAQILTAGGYALDWIYVVDQFRWSPHVELAARFSRKAAPPAR